MASNTEIKRAQTEVGMDEKGGMKNGLGTINENHHAVRKINYRNK